ncbi:isoleucine--tRNA ligase [Abyssicoccus albus]|uniref:isoleucine--tRNA ligase n=1 Tax=Abyssicoccus albus TaxID=1817405 RepID=UPI00097E3C71|nr:isoleucine--tRNA ligase [Abyssicoccus albus]AQL56368.1 isoleucine--tRNA ligase [Abyssicoccus albus]
MDYKDTLLMPKTGFKMKGGLINKEPNYQAQWETQNIYQKQLEKNKDSTPYILHDGPPFANGSVHMGHALNKTVKDIILRIKSMQGYYTPFVPGWDTHGLPIEQELTKKGVKRKEMSDAEFRKLCEEFALDQIDNQREVFKRLGIQGDFDNPYITMQKEYEAEQLRVFAKMVERGLIYKGKKPIYWSPSSESSLAEAEIEYQDKRSPSIYVAFPVEDGKGVLDQEVNFIIWTTTPWTIPSNLGISVNADLNYVQFSYGESMYVVAEALLDDTLEALEWDKDKVDRIHEFKGSELEYITCKHPLYDRTSLVILGDHVTTDAGTGCVHTAPGHGEDDFVVGQRYDIGVISPLDSKGVFTNEVEDLEGVFYDDANKVVGERLDEANALLSLKFITHSYPHDWRTKKPVIFRATPQWFASIQKIRQDILKAIDQTEFKVEWGHKRIYNMVRDRQDWVISRQRVWGVPIPVFYAEDGSIIMDKQLIDHVASLVEQHGTNVWYEREAKDLLPDGYTHPGSPNGDFTKEMDIMDVWFDSGSSHQAVVARREELSFPADLYFEGSDQYRGWFNSSITTSVAVANQSPYKMLLSHGFVMDGEGKKMSKSVGNVIDPAKVMKQMGADIIRLWAMSVDYESDVRVSQDILKQNSEVYRKIRNTFRFMLGNVADYDPNENKIDYDQLEEIDQFMLQSYYRMMNASIEDYNRHEFLPVYQRIQNFINVELSNFYLDYGKDILYIEAMNDHKRRSMQTVLYEILTGMTKLLAPILVHTAEEVYEHTPHTTEESIHLESMPEQVEVDLAIIKRWNDILSIRDDVLRALEKSRNDKVIGKSLEAQVTIGNTKQFDAVTKLKEINTQLKQLFIVSKVDIATEVDESFEQYQYAAVKVQHADGIKCERCWNYVDDTVEDEAHPNLCVRCHDVVTKS